MGIYWNGLYFLDKNLVFGAIHWTAIFECITDFVRFLMAKQGFLVHNYIDDIYACCHKDHAHRVFEMLKSILQRLGLPLNEKKVLAPCTNLNIMGIVIDIRSVPLSSVMGQCTKSYRNA